MKWTLYGKQIKECSLHIFKKEKELQQVMWGGGTCKWCLIYCWQCSHPSLPSIPLLCPQFHSLSPHYLFLLLFSSHPPWSPCCLSIHQWFFCLWEFVAPYAWIIFPSSLSWGLHSNVIFSVRPWSRYVVLHIHNPNSSIISQDLFIYFF